MAPSDDRRAAEPCVTRAELEALTPEAYAQIGGGICEPFPLEARLAFPGLSHDSGS